MNKVKACLSSDLIEGGYRLVEAGGMEIGLYRIEGKVYAWRNLCPHAGAPVCLGLVTGTTLPSEVYEYTYGKEQQVLRCPWHGWEFDLTTGSHLVEGSRVKLRGFEVVEEGGHIIILFRSRA